MSNMEVIRLTTFDNETMQQVDGLLHMLSPQSQPVESTRLESLIKEGRLHLFICRDDNADIIGMLTLTCCPTLARDKYWIEDVIVNETFRGQGAGRALLRAAVGYARQELKASCIYLTSNPSRVQARALYRSEGFEEYETGVFRIREI